MLTAGMTFMKLGRMPRYSPRKPSLATIPFSRELMEGWSDASRDAGGTKDELVGGVQWRHTVSDRQ